MRTAGICFGASTVQFALVRHDPSGPVVEKTLRIAHEGKPAAALGLILAQVDTAVIDRIAVTGRSLRSSVRLSGISEPQAVEYALRASCANGPFPDIVISSGGETQLVYTVGVDGGITGVHTGSKCASGTGEFFIQQVGRLGLTVEQAVGAAGGGTPYKIAGRCSVFCKSDCTHALNKGEPKENIAAGLCLMMAEKICGLIDARTVASAMIVGGGSLNQVLVGFLRQRFAGVRVPENATVFEAFGTALWAARNECLPLPASTDGIITTGRTSFGFHPPLSAASGLVEFRSHGRGVARAGDTCIFGLDVGSTTTKAVLMRQADRAVLASVYLRTDGSPVEASRRCYAGIREQLAATPVAIVGLGVTGSGRQIAALHALSKTVINEITAHAAATAFYDPSADTIFEIGGQDAKYTYLTAGVPSDYAMNEACSAGTGSFLEEAARETLGVTMESIADRALQAGAPPDFRDECAAFISSDVKLAAQEGIGTNDILAGLVYSICLNYLNRVKGSRPVGSTVFMQGGVCYNRAVPMAMAALLKTRIIVPPEPGLMGAFGVALETAVRLEAGLAQPERFDLEQLASRTALREGEFTCAGGTEKCDRKCRISRIRIEGALHPFGGICDRYYNLRLNKKVDAGAFDLVAVRQRLLYEEFGRYEPEDGGPVSRVRGKTVGINRSFITHSLFPLFSRFFTGIGCRVVLSDGIDEEGFRQAGAEYCFPALQSHGAFLNLLSRKPDFIFLPQVMQVPVPNVPTFSRLCVFVQGEPYYLKTAFRDEIMLAGTTILTPVLKLENGYEAAQAQFVDIGSGLGVDAQSSRTAYAGACAAQRGFEEKLREHGRSALAWLADHPDTFGVVLFGRPYNTFAAEANKGVPHKTASHGHLVIPHDMLDADEFAVDRKMFWAMGQKIMKAAQFVRRHDSLFGFYVSNFSCGPDSFLTGYFRDAMGDKPSLTLEMDQHTANAGIDTRIEAALDIMRAWRALRRPASAAAPFVAARIEESGGVAAVIASDGTRYGLKNPKVRVLVPAMGRYSSAVAAAVMRRIGIHAEVLPTADRSVLLTARKHASCKECLPYQVILGSYLTYLENRPADDDAISVLFIPTGGGPCRLGQYCRAIDMLITKLRLRDTAVLTLTDENGYGGFGPAALLKAWQGIVTADIFEDARSMLTVAAADPADALGELESCFTELIAYLEGRLSIRFTTLLSLFARRLSAIPLKTTPSDVPVVSMIGEYYVRKDDFSRRNILEYLQNEGFMVKVAPAQEYLLYSQFVVHQGLGERPFSRKELLKMKVTASLQEWWEWRIKSIMAKSGLYRFELTDVKKTVRGVSHLINENFRGECILTVGLGLREILDHSCGVISFGPFGCMPSRMAEAILRREMTPSGKARLPGWEEKARSMALPESFPFLAIETDGNPFPQIVEANLEAFVIQVRKLHGTMHGTGSRRPVIAAQI